MLPEWYQKRTHLTLFTSHLHIPAVQRLAGSLLGAAYALVRTML
jgi:hypothetical protein